MKTPEQITEEVAEQMVTENELLRASGETARDSLAWELVNGETLIVEHALEDLVNRAIEADRAQREADVIAQKVWILEDFESYWNTHYADDYSLSPEQTRKIIESAPNYLYHAALEDCTDAEWDAIDEALISSIKAELGEAGS